MKKTTFFVLFLAIFLALFISPFASQQPDGLERVAIEKGFLKKGEGRPISFSLIPDYSWPGISNEKLATAYAGVSGTLLVFFLTYLAARLLLRRRS